MLENFFGEEIEKTVFLSAAQMREAHPGPVRGKYFKDTAIFNIFPPELSERGEFLGQILPEGFEPNAKGFCGVARQEKIQFYFDGKPINAEPYELHQNIFSRNKGILETDKMDHKRAVILGCGSVGSLVAMELARSGVGHFLLADPDVMEYHNICRHQCGIEDVGDLQSIHFEEILPPEPFQGSTAKVLKLPMGIGDGDSVVSMVFGEGTSHHGLIGGGTGGGKSTLLHTLIMSSMMNYSPEQLNLYLMDFKGGTEFKIYESERLPHIKLLALDALQEFGESILENLVQEMANRSDIFKRSGGYTKLEDYVTNTGNSMPRILVIMDEFQILFDSGTNRKVAERCANLAKKIVTEGRSYGVHLLMATQSTKIISTLTLDRGTIEQMRIRVGLKCGEDDTRYLFGDTHCSDAMKKMEGPRGTAVLNEDYTENNPNVGLRVAFCNDETKKYYLKQISEKFADSPCTMQVFEGSRTVPMLDYLAARSIGIADTSTVTVHMGEKIKVDDPFELTFDRKKQHNVLICGSNDELMDRTVNLFLLSAALNRRACVYCVDGDSIVGDDRCGSFYQSLEHGVAELHTAHTRSDIVQFVHDLYEKYQQRKKKTGGDTVLFVIKNLQFLDLMQTMLLGDRVDEAEYIEFPAEPKAVDVPPTVVEDPTLDLLAGFSAEPTDSPVEPTGFSTKPADDDPFAALLAQVPSLTADVAPAESQNVEERDPFADLMASFSSIGADSSYTSAQPASGVLENASEKLQKLIADGAAYPSSSFSQHRSSRS